MRDSFVIRAMRNVIEAILSSATPQIPYRNLFARAMEYPLLTPENLNEGIRSLPFVELKIDKPHRLPSAKTDRKDHVVILDRKGLQKQLDEMKEKDKAPPEPMNLL